MRKNAFIIFSGNNPRAILAFCRFATSNKIEFYIISSGKDDQIYKTTYRNKVAYCRQNRILDYESVISIIFEIREKHNLEYLYILPSSEFLNRFLLNNKVNFERDGIRIPLVSERLYSQISDKYSFSRICGENNFKVPGEFPTLEEVEFPFVIKPKEYDFQNKNINLKPQIIHSKEKLFEWQKTNDPSLYYFQEFINGDSIYLLYYLSEDSRNTVKFSQKNFIQQPNGGSIIAAISSTHFMQPIAVEYENLLKKIGFKGLIMIEVKENKGKYCMIEANPRLWGPSQLFVDAKVPIFENFVRECGFKIDETHSNYLEPTRYFWMGGIFQNNKRYDQLTFHSVNPKKFFLEELESWIKVDVYKRDDTIDLFLTE